MFLFVVCFSDKWSKLIMFLCWERILEILFELERAILAGCVKLSET